MVMLTQRKTVLNRSTLDTTGGGVGAAASRLERRLQVRLARLCRVLALRGDAQGGPGGGQGGHDVAVHPSVVEVGLVRLVWGGPRRRQKTDDLLEDLALFAASVHLAPPASRFSSG